MADGLIGVTDRACIVSSYSTYTTERNLHCHLYNTYISEKLSTYNRYYISSSEKYLIAERELIYSEYTLLTTSYNTHNTEKSISYGRGYVTNNNERNGIYTRWYTQYSIRYLHYAITEVSERIIYQFCKWNTYRFGYVKSWYVTERYSTTLGKLYDSYADQRYLWYQLYESPTSIRNCYCESCNFKFTLSITPNYIELLPNTNILPNYQSLFEDEEVVTYKLQFDILKIKDNLKDTDLAFIIWNPIKQQWIEIPISMYGIVNIPLFRYGETNTLFLDGFLVPVSDLLYIGFYPLCSKYTFKYDNDKCYNEVIEASKHGYIKLELLGKQYNWNTKMVIGNVKYQPISLKFYISQNFYINSTGRFNIRMLYGYPTKHTSFNTILKFTQPL